MRAFDCLLTCTCLLLAACGGGNGDPAAQPPGGPSGAPPSAPEGGPPPAWVETEVGPQWLGHSSYCWSADGHSLCADSAGHRCGDRFTPDVQVRRGEVVRFHLGFEPREVVLTMGVRKASEVRLAPARVLEWRVAGTGEIALFATVEGGDASYVACLKSGPS